MSYHFNLISHCFGDIRDKFILDKVGLRIERSWDWDVKPQYKKKDLGKNIDLLLFYWYGLRLC